MSDIEYDLTATKDEIRAAVREIAIGITGQLGRHSPTGLMRNDRLDLSSRC